MFPNPFPNRALQRMADEVSWRTGAAGNEPPMRVALIGTGKRQSQLSTTCWNLTRNHLLGFRPELTADSGKCLCSLSGWRPLDPQEVAVARLPRSLAIVALEARCVAFVHAQVVQHRA